MPRRLMALLWPLVPDGSHKRRDGSLLSGQICRISQQPPFKKPLRSGNCANRAEHDHSRSNQPDAATPRGAHWRPRNRIRLPTAPESGNAASTCDGLRGANGLSPPLRDLSLLRGNCLNINLGATGTRSLVLLFRQCPWWSGGVAIDLPYRPPLHFSEALPLEPGDARRCALNRIGNLRQSPVPLSRRRHRKRIRF